MYSASQKLVVAYSGRFMEGLQMMLTENTTSGFGDAVICLLQAMFAHYQKLRLPNINCDNLSLGLEW